MHEIHFLDSTAKKDFHYSTKVNYKIEVTFQ
jgi:hypothetical protein